MGKKLFTLAGFSLIELMVVAIILGVILALAVPLYLNNAEQAMGAKAMENMNNIFNAEMMYMADNEGFTDVAADLQRYAWFEINDGDWQYAVGATQTTFNITATRINSSYTGSITLDDKTTVGGDWPWPP